MTRSKLTVLPIAKPPKNMKGQEWRFEMYTIALVLVEEAKRREHSYRSLALEAGLWPSTVSSLFRAKTKDPHFSTVLKLCSALGFKLKVV